MIVSLVGNERGHRAKIAMVSLVQSVQKQKHVGMPCLPPRPLLIQLSQRFVEEPAEERGDSGSSKF